MRIGEVAQRAGVGIDTIRLYERLQLLPPAGRTASGYRMFGTAEVERLRFIRRAKALGFTLQEIRELLGLSSHRGDDMAELKMAATQKLLDIENKINELQRIREGLRELIAACPGHGALDQCPILGALAGEDA